MSFALSFGLLSVGPGVVGKFGGRGKGVFKHSLNMVFLWNKNDSRVRKFESYR